MYYIVTEKTRDGEFEYLGKSIVKLQEGEEPSEKLFLEKMYEDGETELTFDDFCRAWQIDGDYRLLTIYHWQLIESEEDKQILNKYRIY